MCMPFWKKWPLVTKEDLANLWFVWKFSLVGNVVSIWPWCHYPRYIFQTRISTFFFLSINSVRKMTCLMSLFPNCKSTSGKKKKLWTRPPSNLYLGHSFLSCWSTRNVAGLALPGQMLGDWVKLNSVWTSLCWLFSLAHNFYWLTLVWSSWPCRLKNIVILVKTTKKKSKEALRLHNDWSWIIFKKQRKIEGKGFLFDF